MAFTFTDITAALPTPDAELVPSGVSFEGRSLKLNTKADAQLVVDAIASCSNMAYFNMEGNTLGVEAAMAIAEALKQQPNLKRALWKDMFTGRLKEEIPKALQYLGNGLAKSGAYLTELDLSDNAFGPIGVKGLASLLRSFSCFTLEELRLNNNGLGIGGGKLLASALLECYNSSKEHGKPLQLKVFIAGRNRLENDGAKALAEVFRTIGSLEEVALPQNGIYFPGITALSESLVYNKNLKILNLNDNTIGPKGAKAIAKALPHLQKLKKINFGDCLLKTEGALHLASSIKQNHVQLEEIVLNFNEICLEAGLALADAVANKDKLKTVVLDGNYLNKTGQKQIEERFKTVGKLDTLGSLEECESDEDDDGKEASTASDEDSVPNGELDESLNTNSTQLTPARVTSFNDFLNAPTIEKFLNLGVNREYIILAEAKKMSNYLNELVPLIMKISALSSTSQSPAVQNVVSCSEKLYKELFVWAVRDDHLSLVNNTILEHLGLIKSENKKFKPTWNTSPCLSTLKNILDKNFVPQTTKDTVKFFIGRKSLNSN